MPEQHQPQHRSWSVNLRAGPWWRQLARQPWLIGLLVVALSSGAAWFVRAQLAQRAPWLTSRFQSSSTGGYDYWAMGSPGENEANDLCGTPGWPDSRWYGQVETDELPWHRGDDDQTPAQLAQLRQQHHGEKIVAAFRITLPDPQFHEAYNVGHAAQRLAGQVVEPGAIFSANQNVGPYTAAEGFRLGPSYAGNRLVQTEGGGVCKIASALYNAVSFSGLEVVERHPHTMLVPYAPPGRDATVAVGVKDFRFRNDSDHPLVIWSAMDDLDLYVAFYSNFEPPQVEWGHEVLAEQETWTIRQPNDELPTGEERILHEGYPGLTVRTWLEESQPGQPPQRHDRGIDTYQPMPKLVEYGP